MLGRRGWFLGEGLRPRSLLPAKPAVGALARDSSKKKAARRQAAFLIFSRRGLTRFQALGGSEMFEAGATCPCNSFRRLKLVEKTFDVVCQELMLCHDIWWMIQVQTYALLIPFVTHSPRE